MIQAAIFDLDGVIIDSEQVWYRLNRDFLVSKGITPSDELIYKTIGGSMDLTYRVMWEAFPEGTITMSRVREEYNEFSKDFTLDFKSILDKDAAEMLRQLRAEGIRTALASASPRSYIDHALEECGITGLFDVIVSGTQFVHNKPEPDVYLKAGELLSVPMEQCLVVEDSDIGLKAGRNSGAVTAGVKGYGNQDLSKADFALKNGLKQVPYLCEYLNKKDQLVRLQYKDKELILIPVAHVSKVSARLVDEVADFERPDCICIELDQDRCNSLTQKKKWEDTSVSSIIKQHRTGYFLVSLILSSFQKRIAANNDSSSGQEMLEGIRKSREYNIPLVLADRSVQTTFTRIWRLMKGKDKFKLLTGLISGIFDDEDITEEDLAKLEQKDELTAALSEMQKEFPQISDVLVTERDKYLAYKIKNAPGKKIAAVLGAAHTIGIREWINQDYPIEPLDELPPKGKGGTIFLWALSVILVLLVVLTFTRDAGTGVSQVVNWILWHGILSAAGCILCLAHPLTILTAFCASPLSSLSPLLAAGWFAGLVEAHIRKPAVKDFEALSGDLSSFKGFWTNKITRVLMIVIMANIGSSLATVFAGIDIVRKFMEVFG